MPAIAGATDSEETACGYQELEGSEIFSPKCHLGASDGDGRCAKISLSNRGSGWKQVDRGYPWKERSGRLRTLILNFDSKQISVSRKGLIPLARASLDVSSHS